MSVVLTVVVSLLSQIATFVIHGGRLGQKMMEVRHPALLSTTARKREMAFQRVKDIIDLPDMSKQKEAKTEQMPIHQCT